MAAAGRQPPPSGVDRRAASAVQWQLSSLLHSAERGDTQYELIPISEGEADRIVAWIRKAIGPEE
jgi:hypothetical protein